MRGGRTSRTTAVAALGIALLAVSLWAASVAARWLAETSLSGLLGVPVRLSAVRVSGFPLRLLLVGVRVGPAGAPSLSAARVYLRGDPWALLHGRIEGGQVEIWGPRMHGSADEGSVLRDLLARTAELPEGGDGVRLEELRVDEVRVDEAPGRAPLVLSGFRLGDVVATRTAAGPVSVRADLTVMSATGTVTADVRRTDRGPSLLVDAEVSDLSLGLLVRGDGWGVRGRASGTLWYEYLWEAGAPTHLAGGTVTVRDFVMEAEEANVVDAAEIELDRVSVDVGARAVAVGRLRAAGGGIGRAALVEGATSESAAPWIVAIESGQLEDFALEGSDPPFTVRRLELSEVASDGSTGWLALDASYGDGRIHLEAEREGADRVASAVLSLEALPLAPVFAGRLGGVEWTRGTLDARLALQGPPGIGGEGTVELRDVEIVAPGIGGPQPLLSATRVRADVDQLSFWPLRARWLRALAEAPRVWVRRDREGFQIPSLWDAIGATAPSQASALERVLRRVLRWAGPTPPPTDPPRPAGLRISDGTVDVVDRSVDPPFQVRLRHVDAVAGGPEGTAGPLSFRGAARGPGRSRLRVRGEQSSATASLEIALHAARLRTFEPYLLRFTGYEVTGGRFDLEIDAKLRPEPRARGLLAFAGVSLRPSGEDDPWTAQLGAPLPEIVARLEAGGRPGQIEVDVPGEAGAPAFGFGDSLPEALRTGVDRALANAAETNGSTPATGESKRPGSESGASKRPRRAGSR